MAPQEITRRWQFSHPEMARADVEPRSPQSTLSTSVAGPPSQKRAYKACESCRKHKAKCVMSAYGDACVKCWREGKECAFPLHRSSKRRRFSPLANVTGNGGRDSTRPPSTALLQLADEINRGGMRETDQTTNVSQEYQTQQSLAEAPYGRGEDRAEANDQPSATDELGAEVVQTAVTSSRDAIGLLFKAAAHDSTDAQEEDEDGGDSSDGPRGAGDVLSPYATPSQSVNGSRSIPPELLALWSKHRFVRQGWFTAHEAIAFIQL